MVLQSRSPLDVELILESGLLDNPIFYVLVGTYQHTVRRSRATHLCFPMVAIWIAFWIAWILLLYFDNKADTELRRMHLRRLIAQERLDLLFYNKPPAYNGVFSLSQVTLFSSSLPCFTHLANPLAFGSGCQALQNEWH